MSKELRTEYESINVFHRPTKLNFHKNRFSSDYGVLTIPNGKTVAEVHDMIVSMAKKESYRNGKIDGANSLREDFANLMKIEY